MQQSDEALPNIQTILLKTCFSNIRKAGVDTRPLTKLLSTLFGSVSEGLGYSAILSASLLSAQGRSMKNAQFQSSLLMDLLREMESTLTDSYAASLPENEKLSN